MVADNDPRYMLLIYELRNCHSKVSGLNREVEKLAGLHGIFLRTGCFCNPGACALHLGITASQSKRNFEAGHVCWDDHDIIDGR